MKRTAILALTIALILCCVVALYARRQATPPGQASVYAPWQVFTDTLRHPRAWRGRMVLVRGVLHSTAQAGLYELRAPSSSDNAGQSLFVTVERPPVWLASLRRIPLVARLAPPVPLGGAVRVYRVMTTIHPCLPPLTGNQCIQEIIRDD